MNQMIESALEYRPGTGRTTLTGKDKAGSVFTREDVYSHTGGERS
jgi:hypothetical protein